MKKILTQTMQYAHEMREARDKLFGILQSIHTELMMLNKNIKDLRNALQVSGQKPVAQKSRKVDS